MRVIRKLTGILVDNAVKYVDEGGEMRPKSGNRRQILHKFNRKFCTKYGISTSFVRKGRAAKDEPLRKVLIKIVLMLLLLKIGLMFFLMYGKFIV